MNKYGGQLIYQADDEYGVVEVVDYKKVIRCLHFGNSIQQSGMYLYNHISLLHPYTQAMLSVTAIQKPERVLLLGVGGGSMVKFLLHFFPHVVVDAIDIRQAVFDVAHEYFDMPVRHPRLNLHLTDFRDFLDQTHMAGTNYDLILVDLFSADEHGNIIVGIGKQVQQLKSLLTGHGLMAVNVLDGDIQALDSLDILSTLFAGSLYEIPVDGINTIALASMKLIKDFPTELEFQAFETKYLLAARKYLQNMLMVS